MLIWLFLILGLLLASSVFQQWLRRTKGARGEKAVARAILSSGAAALHDIILPDGRGGLTQVDHVIKLPVGIAVIETKNFSGQIFGRERDDTWTQVMGRQKNQFMNPLRQNYLHVQAIKKLVDGVDVIGQVIFVGDAQLRHPVDGVSGLRDLTKHLKMVRTVPIPQEVEQAWARLNEHIRCDSEARRLHSSQVRLKKIRRT